MKPIFFYLFLFYSGFCFPQTLLDKTWDNIFYTIINEMKEYSADNQLDFYFNKLEKKRISVGLSKTNLKLGLELLRIKDNPKEIILRKSEYPIPNLKNDLTALNYLSNMNLEIYSGLFSIPLHFSQDKKFMDSLKFDQKESIYAYGLIVVPIKKENNSYLLRLSLLNYLKIFGVNVIINFRDQETWMKTGERIRIDINPAVIGRHVNIVNDESNINSNTTLHGMYGIMHNIHSDDNGWMVNPTINGKTITFSSDNDFFRGINDHLILSLEADK